jgi:TrmH family RNA methyltransferase
MSRAPRIVLVATSHPGNIGAAARAMKTMGLSELHLVAPAQFPDPQATAMAAGADDILEQACVHADLPAALAGCHWVAGLSARPRALSGPDLDARRAAETLAHQGDAAHAALVFGRERTGLTNEELDLCHVRVNIPANPAYGSLNLAAAVQVMGYEWRMASAMPYADSAAVEVPDELASAEAIESFHEHLEEVLAEIGFLDRGNPRQLMRRMRRLLHRARPEAEELNILRGILSAVQGGRTRRSGGATGRDV